MKLEDLRARMRTQEKQPTRVDESTPAPSHLAKLTARIKSAIGEVIHTVTVAVGDAKAFSAQIDETCTELFRQRLIGVEMSDESLTTSCVRCTAASPHSALCPDCVFLIASSIVRKEVVSVCIKLQCGGCGVESLHNLRPKAAALIACPGCGAHGYYKP